jgi:hypothetical protein
MGPRVSKITVRASQSQIDVWNARLREAGYTSIQQGFDAWTADQMTSSMASSELYREYLKWRGQAEQRNKKLDGMRPGLFQTLRSLYFAAGGKKDLSNMDEATAQMLKTYPLKWDIRHVIIFMDYLRLSRKVARLEKLVRSGNPELPVKERKDLTEMSPVAAGNGSEDEEPEPGEVGEGEIDAEAKIPGEE